jgi:hypothetical protein
MRRFILSSLVSLALAAPALASTVTLTWTNPTTHTDGSPITGALTTQVWDTVTVSNQPPANTQIGTGTSPFQTGQLATGSHAFTVINCEANAACSTASNVFTATISAVAPAAVTNLTGTVGP